MWFYPCPIATKFSPVIDYIWIEVRQNIVFSEIYITMTTINNKSRILRDLDLSYWKYDTMNLKCGVQQIASVRI